MIRSVFKLSAIGILVLFCCCTSLVYGETYTQKFEYKVGNVTPSYNKEIKIDLPEEFAQKNLIFVKRNVEFPVNQVSVVTPKGKIIGISERLTANSYYLNTRCMNGFWSTPGKKAEVVVTLEIGANPSTSPVLDPPSGLTVTGAPFAPTFNWKGAGKHAALSVIDVKDGKTVFERVVFNSSSYTMDEGTLKPLSEYIWAVKQSDETGRYSKETQARFSIKYRVETCTKCNGVGKIRCQQCNGSGSIHTPNGEWAICGVCEGTGKMICPTCNGKGKVQIPYIEEQKGRDFSAANLDISADMKSGSQTMVVNGQVHLAGWGWVAVYPGTTNIPGRGCVTYYQGHLFILHSNHWTPVNHGDDWLNPNTPGEYGEWHP